MKEFIIDKYILNAHEAEIMLKEAVSSREMLVLDLKNNEISNRHNIRLNKKPERIYDIIKNHPVLKYYTDYEKAALFYGKLMLAKNNEFKLAIYKRKKAAAYEDILKEENTDDKKDILMWIEKKRYDRLKEFIGQTDYDIEEVKTSNKINECLEELKKIKNEQQLVYDELKNLKNIYLNDLEKSKISGDISTSLLEDSFFENENFKEKSNKNNVDKDLNNLNSINENYNIKNLFYSKKYMHHRKTDLNDEINPKSPDIFNNFDNERFDEAIDILKNFDSKIFNWNEKTDDNSNESDSTFQISQTNDETISETNKKDNITNNISNEKGIDNELNDFKIFLQELIHYDDYKNQEVYYDNNLEKESSAEKETLYIFRHPDVIDYLKPEEKDDSYKKRHKKDVYEIINGKTDSEIAKENADRKMRLSVYIERLKKVPLINEYTDKEAADILIEIIEEAFKTYKKEFLEDYKKIIYTLKKDEKESIKKVLIYNDFIKDKKEIQNNMEISKKMPDINNYRPAEYHETDCKKITSKEKVFSIQLIPSKYKRKENFYAIIKKIADFYNEAEKVCSFSDEKTSLQKISEEAYAVCYAIEAAAAIGNIDKDFTYLKVSWGTEINTIKFFENLNFRCIKLLLRFILIIKNIYQNEKTEKNFVLKDLYIHAQNLLEDLKVSQEYLKKL